jgi:predicted nucleic acid-binding Zn ribbon protein
MEAVAAEAEGVLRTADHEQYAKAAGLRNAVAAGLAPPAAFVRDVRAALQQELRKAGQRASSPEVELDFGTTRATRVTVRGVLKRFEEAFGTGATSSSRARREK